MKVDVVEFYTWNILKKQLQNFKISNNALYPILDNVKEQLYSMIANWNDLTFRNALLIIGSEEGYFYEPKNELIANMVVVTIRNSLLEGVSSDAYKTYGSLHYLQDFSIKEITSKAIEYFSNIDLVEASHKIQLFHDFYRETAYKYPTAMRALTELSQCTEENKEHEYEPVKVKVPFVLEELNHVTTLKNDKNVNVESGIDATFSASLCHFLKDIQDGNSKVFVTDCFKMTTRNFEKILKILEFILTHNALFVTCNYLLSNGYVARRKTLLKASHTSDQFFQKIKYLPDISEKYKPLLNEISK